MPTRILTIDNSELLRGADTTITREAASIGDVSITVGSISQISTNTVLLLGFFGDESALIVNTHSVSAPSGSTVPFSAAITKYIPENTQVTVLRFDTIEIYTAPTETGTKTLLTSISVDPEKESTTYAASTSSGYFFVRWKNSVTLVTGEYSDAIPVTGFSSNTIASIIDEAMREKGAKYSERLTYQGLIHSANSCLRYVRGELKRWSNVSVYDISVGTMTRGINSFPLPSDYYNQSSPSSMLNVKIGGNTVYDYYDKREIDDSFRDIGRTTVAITASAGNTSITLENGADFADNGSMYVYSSGSLQTLSYTSKSGNVFSGIPSSGDGAILSTISSGDTVFSALVEKVPSAWSVYDGNLYFNSVPDSTTAGKNVSIDYYTDIVEINSDSDVISFARYDMMKYWLKWTIHNILYNNGTPDFNSGDWVMFNTALTAAKRQETTGQKFKRVPRINGIRYRTSHLYE